MGISLSNCANYDVKKITPHFIDTKKQVCRKYVVTETKPEILFKFDSELPIDFCNSYVAVPVDQFQEAKRYYNEWVNHRNKNEVEQERPFRDEIDKETYILKGIQLK